MALAPSLFRAASNAASGSSSRPLFYDWKKKRRDFEEKLEYATKPMAELPNTPMQLTPLRVRKILAFLQRRSGPSVFPIYRWRRN